MAQESETVWIINNSKGMFYAGGIKILPKHYIEIVEDKIPQAMRQASGGTGNGLKMVHSDPAKKTGNTFTKMGAKQDQDKVEEVADTKTTKTATKQKTIPAK